MTSRMPCIVLLMLVALPAPAADVGLGRLFFTPAQRQALEEARRKNVRAEVQAAEKPARPPVRNVHVTGVVRRSDGESTVWVNGKPVDGTTADGLKVRVTAGQQAAVIVQEPDHGHILRLKVGQRANILTGRIEESYERRQPAAAQAELPEPTPPPARSAAPHNRTEPQDEAGQIQDDDGAAPSDAGKDGRG